MPSINDHGVPRTEWTATHTPVVNTVATITRASAGTGRRNVCTGLTVGFAAGTAAPSAVTVTVKLIDGGAGGSTILWAIVLSLPAVAGASTGAVRHDVWLPGSAATAMTLEFNVEGGANTFESVSMEGVTERVR